MSEAKNIFVILDELKGNAKQIDNEGLESVERLITEAKRIFVGGAGRSGFAARGFSNRLMHNIQYILLVNLQHHQFRKVIF